MLLTTFQSLSFSTQKTNGAMKHQTHSTTQNAVFRRLAEVAEVSKLSKEERIKYDRALKRYRDMYNTITGAEAKGEAKGRAEERMAML